VILNILSEGTFLIAWIKGSTEVKTEVSLKTKGFFIENFN
jgi:hypothetical protein